jgi:hypothetical protein
MLCYDGFVDFKSSQVEQMRQHSFQVSGGDVSSNIAMG